MKFTHYTIIGKNPAMIKGHLDNVVHHAGFERMDCDKELVTIVYRNPNISKEITTEICDICSSFGSRVEFFDEPDNVFLTNLYACWNLGYVKSDEGWVFRSGSDEAFNYDSMPNLYDVAMRTRETTPKLLLNLNTIEHAVRAMSRGNVSRHMLGNFGDDFTNFDVNKFEEFIKEINKNVMEELLDVNQSNKYWGKPTPFYCTLGSNHNRTEGSAWMITKDDWLKYGPMNPINYGVTGDCYLHDKLELAGYKDYLTRDAVTFHFFRGESIQRY